MSESRIKRIKRIKNAPNSLTLLLFDDNHPPQCGIIAGNCLNQDLQD